MGKKVYIGNLSYETNDHSITALFAEFGEVQSAQVITDRFTGRSKGFGFVEMNTESAASAAIEKLNGLMLSGRALTVSEAKPMAPKNGRGLNGDSDRRRY